MRDHAHGVTVRDKSVRFPICNTHVPLGSIPSRTSESTAVPEAAPFRPGRRRHPAATRGVENSAFMGDMLGLRHGGLLQLYRPTLAHLPRPRAAQRPAGRRSGGWVVRASELARPTRSRRISATRMLLPNVRQCAGLQPGGEGGRGRAAKARACPGQDGRGTVWYCPACSSGDNQAAGA